MAVYGALFGNTTGSRNTANGVDVLFHNTEGSDNTANGFQALVNAMLLNEFLKAHRRIEEEDKRIDQLTAQLKEQALLIQKVNVKVQLNKAAPQTVANDQ